MTRDLYRNSSSKRNLIRNKKSYYSDTRVACHSDDM